MVSGMTAAFMNLSALHGYYWLDDPGDVEANATQAVAFLLQHLPRRDALLLGAAPYQFMDFLIEHVRYALQTRGWSAALGVDWPTFLEYVLPYGILTEKRDLWFRWRPRFYQLLQPLVAGAPNITAAMHAVVDAIPLAQAQGALAFADTPTPAAGADAAATETLAPGPPVTWHSETSPAFLSPQQVVQLGGSCTGTGILLVAAARSVGIPARLAGCSESVVRGDDHHWAEFYEPADVGNSPFGDGWHTREGSSAGNPDGPWDAPSGPMLGCLQGVVPGSAMDTLWATSWSSPTFLPSLWANDSFAAAWGHVGGLNRCGAYCGAWGCGPNNTEHWTQGECGPTTLE